MRTMCRIYLTKMLNNDIDDRNIEKRRNRLDLV